MHVSHILKTAEKFTTDNSPLILTAIGAAGVITTGVLAFRGGMDAQLMINAEEERLKWRKANEEQKSVLINEPPQLSVRDKLALTWPCYAPACGVGLLTVGAVVGANRVSTRRAAAMAAAYSLSIEAFDEYKDKVKEKLGERKEMAVRDEVVQDRVTSNPPTDENVIVVTSDSDPIFQDSWSGRYFRTNTENIRQAVNQLNHVVNMDGYATLTDFYELIGLSKTLESDEVGWNTDKLLDVYFAAAIHDNGKVPVMAIDYRVVPSRNYHRTR